MADWKWNPKVKGSGIIECIPQTGQCPNGCVDCFFNGGRSYLEPLSENLPHIPTKEMAHGRVVRMNDGNDSNVQRELVERTAKQFEDVFFNTSNVHKLSQYPGPVVLTLNPANMTDKSFWVIKIPPINLMFCRIRTNMWNLKTVVKHAIEHYTIRNKVPIVLTYMAYYTQPIPKKYSYAYVWKKRTLNSYWCLKDECIQDIEDMFADNPLVHSCGYKGHACTACGNCLREYYATKERMRKECT